MHSIFSEDHGFVFRDAGRGEKGEKGTQWTWLNTERTHTHTHTDTLHIKSYKSYGFVSVCA